MSYSFYLETSPPDFHETMAAVSYDLECEEEGYDFFPSSGPFPDETFFHFFIRGISTRSVEVGYTHGSLQVRIMTCSCAEEYDAAFQLVKHVAKTHQAPIISEDRDDPIAWEEFDKNFDDAWVDHMVQSGATMLPALIRDETMATPLTLPGPVRDFHIGPKLLAQIEDDPRPLVEALFERIRETRFFDPDEFYFHANLMTMQFPSSDTPVGLSAFGPGVDYVFPKVDYFALIDESSILIPSDIVLQDLEANYDVLFLDECQVAVPAIEDSDWEDFLARMRPHQVDLSAKE